MKKPVKKLVPGKWYRDRGDENDSEKVFLKFSHKNKLGNFFSEMKNKGIYRIDSNGYIGFLWDSIWWKVTKDEIEKFDLK